MIDVHLVRVILRTEETLIILLQNMVVVIAETIILVIDTGMVIVSHTEAPCRVLGIFQMSKFTTENHLREIFGRYGPIETIQVIRDPHDGRSRRFGFVNMENVADAQRARDALTDTLIHERKVRVDFSFTSKTNGPMQGKYRGRNTSPRERRHFENNHYHSDGYFRTGSGHFGGRRFNAPYHLRRRANTRDRRRRDHPNDLPQNDHYEGRSRSPGYHSGHKGHDSYHRDSYYDEPRDSREYEESRGTNGHGFRSSQGSYGRDYGRDRGYVQSQRGRDNSEIRQLSPPPPPPLLPPPRGGYRSKMPDSPLY
ncbi:Transformer-2 protein alpha [Coemansia sp. RSA 1365]|nr:Transformer-2 protein alpha [Coemansia sp. RSA 1365]